MNLDVGSIAGDYQVVGILGAGGMGKVYKVRNTISDRLEAMKVLLPDLAKEPDLASRFLREIKVMASLDHPNIAGLRTAVRVENQLLMIVELVEGTTLESLVKDGPLPVAKAVDYIGQVLAALGFAHRAGVVHRDIKPANIMLMPNGVIKLLDFGIAKSTVDRRLTQTGMTMGSLYYMSPEQIQGASDLDSRADLYSVGITLYELVTGKKPFDGDSQFAIMSAHLQQQPVPPIQLDPRLPAALNDIILLSVQKDRTARFQTADAFRSALMSIGGAAQGVAPALGAAAARPPAQSAPKSRRGLWVAAGALAAVAAVVGVIQFGPKKNVGAEEPPAVVSTPPAAAEAPPQVQTPAPAPQQTTPAAQPPAVVSSPPATQKNTPAAQVQRPPAATPPEVVQQPVMGTPTAQPPPQQQQVQQQAPPAAAPAPDPAIAARRAELMKVREDYAMLSARAVSIRSTMANMQRSQAAGGLGMRGDWVQAANLMESFLKAASDAANASDPAAAKDFMGKAERQIDKLETAFNK